MNRMFGATVALLLSGCAAPRHITRAEWLQMSTHTFSGTTVEEVLTAGEKVMLACDGSDFSIQHAPDRVVGERRYLVYLVLAASMGRFVFDFSATQHGDDVVTHLNLTHSAQGITPTPTVGPGGAGMTAGTGPVSGAAISNAGTYELFHARVEAVLKSLPWMTCAEAYARDGDSHDSLCLNAADEVPEGLTLSKRSAQLKADANKRRRNR